MIEHSVPQNVTSYQFHLIGNMTIKQFLLLLSGVGVAGLIYTTNLIGIIKWPLILIFVLLGVALAFVPYEERSLDQWLVNFVRAMYRPTKYFWRRLGTTPELFLFTPRSENDSAPVRPGLTGVNRRRQVNQYLSTLRPGQGETPDADPLDMFSKDTGALEDLFASVTAARDVVPSEVVTVKPKLQVRSRPLKEHALEATKPSEETLLVKTESAPHVQQDPPPQPAAPAEKPHTPAIVKEIGIVTNEKSAAAEAVAAESAVPAPAAPATPKQAFVESAASSTASSDGLQPVTFNRSLPFPSLPDKPNILIGMVYDTAGSILPNAILEIINEQGNTVRALKTNSLGQFYTSTPLPAGKYVIETELDGFTFPRLTLVAENHVLDPIEIRPTGQA